MRREITAQLYHWKDKKNRKPLLLTGVRQCGKTYVLKEFGKSAFEDLAYINFDGNDAISSVFMYDFDVKRILRELETVVLKKKITPGKTLLVFDEIQACPRAIASLKYFNEDMPELHLIAAGSLLGVAIRSESISFPVGKVDRLEMYPMSFYEFTEADGGKGYLEGLQQLPLDREIPELYTIPMEKYLRDYYIVGGMPEAVQTWVETHDYQEVEEVQDRILKDYPDDFGKHIPAGQNKIRIIMDLNAIWDSIPVQIARENNRFIFSHVKSGARAKDLEGSLQWMVNAGLVYCLHLVEKPEIPLSGMADATYFKVYMADVGLLRRKSNISTRTILESSGNFIHFKGALTENFVLTQLQAMGINSYFWRSKSSAELDFLTDYGGELIPIEVKSADNTKAKSYRQFCMRYHPRIGFKFSLKNVGDNMTAETHTWSVPLYYIFRIKDYLSK